MWSMLNPQQWGLLAILLISFILLMTERIRLDLTAILLVLALAISGLLEPAEALSGFSSEPAIVVAAIFVLSSGLFHTGISDRLARLIGRLAGSSYSRIVAVMMPAVALLSAFTHHVTLTAMMLPVTLRLCREHNLSPAKLLMPMSFAASLGTTITIIGAPAFLLASGILQQAGRPGLDIFSIAPIGLALSVVGTLYILLLGRFLLPERSGGTDLNDHFRLDGYYTELLIQTDSPFVGKTIDDIETVNDHQFQVVNWLRQGRPRNRPFNGDALLAEDVLLVRTTPEEIAAIEQQSGLALHPMIQYQAEVDAVKPAHADESVQLVQAVIAPGSELVGRTIGKVDFLSQYGVIVVGLWRRRGWPRAELSRVRLREGDLLVLRGCEESFTRLANDSSFLMLLPFQGEPHPHHRAPLAVLIMLGTILAAAFNLLSVEIALLAGAALMVLTRCLTARQAYEAIDVRIFVFIAGAIPLGLAMEKTGTADVLAGWLQGLMSGWPPLLVLLTLFIGTAIVTQFMSDAGTTALLGPVAVGLARALNQPFEPYIVTVAMAAVASFLTPIGHHGNLLIYGPGRYQFSDFLRVGVPLTLIVALVATSLALFLWPV